MNALSAKTVRVLGRALYDCTCAFAIITGATTALLLDLEWQQLTIPSRAALAMVTVVVGSWLKLRSSRRRH